MGDDYIDALSVADYHRACTQHIEPCGNVVPPPKPIYEMTDDELLQWGRDVERRYAQGMLVDGRPITNTEMVALLILGEYRRQHADAEEVLDLAGSSAFDEYVVRAARRIARFLGGKTNG